MEGFLQYFNADFLIVSGLLILMGLYLEKWQPPLKKQYIALALFLAGGLMVYFMLNGQWAYGILIAGSVFQKRELVEEMREIKDSCKGIKQTREEDEDKTIQEQSRLGLLLLEKSSNELFFLFNFK